MEKKKKNIAEVAVKKEKKDVWAGAQSLMKKPTTQAQAMERNLILMTAKALNVSPFGVNILGNLPYINKLGLKEKHEEYEINNKIEYNWIQYAKDDKEKAICAARVVGKCDWVIGECSPSTIKMTTLTGYQNHMAQTRARNRAILEAYGTKIHEEMMNNIQKMVSKKEITESEAANIGNAVTSSSEEMVPDKNQKALPVINQEAPNQSNFLDQLRKEVYKAGAKTPKEAVDLINKKTGLKLSDLKLSEKHASIVLEQWLNSNKK